MKGQRKNQVFRLPDRPWREDTILGRIRQGCAEAKKYYKDGGKMSASVYTSNEDHWEFVSEVMREAIEANPLWAKEFSNIV